MYSVVDMHATILAQSVVNSLLGEVNAFNV